jgi:hypothetical protein
LPIHHIERGRFAGAIGSDQGQHLARFEVKRNVIDCGIAAEGFMQAVDL